MCACSLRGCVLACAFICVNPHARVQREPNDKYVWNRFVMEPLMRAPFSASWLLPIVHGYYSQSGMMMSLSYYHCYVSCFIVIFTSPLCDYLIVLGWASQRTSTHALTIASLILIVHFHFVCSLLFVFLFVCFSCFLSIFALQCTPSWARA